MMLIHLLFLLYFILSSATTTTTVTNVTVVKNSKEHYELCKISYGQRNYITFDLNKLAAPPLLTSLPGSGNSWVRLLIEYSLGYYSGSIYGDTTLFDLFPGEIHCGKRLSVIKVHPGNLIITRNTNEGPIWINHKYSSITCKRGLIKGFNRMLLIIRDPWRTIFSEFVRRQSAASNIQNKMHNTTLTRSSFDERNWIRQAIMQAFEATQFWNKQFPELEKILLSNLQVFRYEDLLDEDTRIDTLRNIIRFINITNDDITTERLECAFLLGDSPTIHRNKSSEISINEVYGDSRLACQLDSEFRKLKVYQRFGYKLTTYNTTDCSTVRSYIKNVDEWIYAVNSSIFDVVLRTGESDFIKNCKTVPDARNRYGAIHCQPNVVPSIDTI